MLLGVFLGVSSRRAGGIFPEGRFGGSMALTDTTIRKAQLKGCTDVRVYFGG